MIFRDRRSCVDAFRPDDSHRMALDHPDLLPLWRRAEPSRPLDLHRTTNNSCGRTSRSWFDRTAIEPRSHKFRREIDPIGSEGGRPISRITIDARSWPDRGAIVARSWHDSGKNLRLFDREIRSKSSRN